MKRPVFLATAEQEDFGVQGHIDYVDPAINPLTGTIRARCRFENENEWLVPGMFRAGSGVSRGSAVAAGPGYRAVVRSIRPVRAGGQRQKHRRSPPRQIGALDGTMRVVVEGLSTSDRVVVTACSGRGRGQRSIR